jgi:peptide/nickel transport system substrate-binding protein
MTDGRCAALCGQGGFPSRVETVLMHNPVSTGKPFGPDGQPRCRLSYVPRQEKASWLAGGKRILAGRIEWATIPDPGTAAAALQNGEVDWLEAPLPDLLPVLRKNRNVVVDITDPLGLTGVLLMNHLFPPFNDVRARRAILTALSQEDYMRAYVGDEKNMWKPMPGFFVPGSPYYNEEAAKFSKVRAI